MQLPAIVTARLSMEPLSAAHAEDLYDVLTDPEVHRYLDTGPPESLEHLRKVYRRLESRRSPDGRQYWLNWAIRPPGHPVVGYVQATVEEGGRTWIGYVLSSRHWGHGLAHTAMQAMLAHVAAAYRAGPFMATVEAANTRSIRLLERLGFRTATPDELKSHSLTATERLYLAPSGAKDGAPHRGDPERR